MILDTGSKSFWLGCFFFLIIANCIIKFVAGLVGANRSDHFSWVDSIDAILVGAIAVGWWFGS